MLCDVGVPISRAVRSCGVRATRVCTCSMVEDPPATSRRLATLGLAASAILASAASMRLPAAPQDPYEDPYDLLELPPLTAAEELVGFVFRPNAPCQGRGREAKPSQQSSPLGIQPAGAADGAACDENCQQRIADRRALFEQSRATSDRRIILDLSRQRAVMYNTTFQGASCIPGIPCW